MTVYLWLLLGPIWIAVWMFVAILKFGNGFSFSRICISNLGNKKISPNSQLYYRLALVPSGILMVPHTILVFLNLNGEGFLYPIAFIILNLIGCFGWTGVGVSLESLDGNKRKQSIHELLATLYFAGFGVNAILFFFWNISLMIRRIDLIPLPLFLIWFIPIIIGLILIIRELFFRGKLLKHRDIMGDKEKFKHQFLPYLNHIEYYSFFMMVIWNAGLIILLDSLI
jgi:hypothetical protein